MRADALENRARVLAAAREVFAESGIDALIPDVAARAGVGNGTVYRHFPTKDALVQALLDDYWQHLEDLRVQALAGDDAWDGITRLLWGMFVIPPEQRVACDLLMASPSDSPYRLHAPPVKDRIADALVELFRRAQEAGSVRRDVPPETMTILLRSVSAAVRASRDLGTDWAPYLQAVLDGLRAPQP